jgi:hypothetical protein
VIDPGELSGIAIARLVREKVRSPSASFTLRRSERELANTLFLPRTTTATPGTRSARHAARRDRSEGTTSDTAYEAGGGMFPEWLKSEYHGVRATLEAHFRSGVVVGKDAAEVCGISLDKGSTANLVVRVTSRGIRTDYRLDRSD